MVLNTYGCRGLRTQAAWPAVVLPNIWAIMGRWAAATAFLKRERDQMFEQKNISVDKRMGLNTDIS